MADFVLVNPPVAPESRLSSNLPNLGLASIAAFLQRQGVETVILDAAAFGWDATTTAERVAQAAPLVCGLSATTPGLPAAAEIAAKIKQRMPDCVTVAGGPHPSARPDETLDTYRSIDYAVIGEGEVTAWEIFQEIERGGEPTEVRGVASRAAGILRLAKHRPPIGQIDDLPPPLWDALPSLATTYGPPVQSTYRLPSAILTTARGDPYGDAYRDDVIFGRKLRMHGAARIFEMMEFLYRRQTIVDFAIMDESLLVDEGRLVELARLLQRSTLPLSFSCQARPDQSLSPFAWRELANAGCWQLVFHLGAGHNSVLRRLGARFTIEQALAALRAAHDAGIATHAHVLLGAPGESLESLAATRRFVLRAPLEDATIGFFAAYPGADLSGEIGTFGRLVGGLAARCERQVSFIPDGLNADLLRRERWRVYRSFYLRTHIILHYLRRLRDRSGRPALWSAFRSFRRRFLRFRPI